MTSDLVSTRGAAVSVASNASRGQRAQQRPFLSPCLADGHPAPDDLPAQVRLAAREQQRVELREVRDRRDGDEVVAAKAPDLALDAALRLRCRLRLIGRLRSELSV